MNTLNSEIAEHTKGHDDLEYENRGLRDEHTTTEKIRDGFKNKLKSISDGFEAAQKEDPDGETGQAAEKANQSNQEAIQETLQRGADAADEMASKMGQFKKRQLNEKKLTRKSCKKLD